MANIAWLNWSSREEAWVLRTWDDGWRLDDTWKCDYQDDENNDLVSDSLLCRMAELSEEGMLVKVTIDGNYRQGGKRDED